MFSFVPIAVVLLFILAAKLPAQDAGRVKVADGEYQSGGQSGYDKNEKSRESWVLWGKGDGKFLVESDLQMEGAGKHQQVLHYTIQLSWDMRPLELSTRAGENETQIELGAVDTLSGADFEPGVAQIWAQFFVSEKPEEANLLQG